MLSSTRNKSNLEIFCHGVDPAETVAGTAAGSLPSMRRGQDEVRSQAIYLKIGFVSINMDLGVLICEHKKGSVYRF